jgi:hypothetical protein
MDREQSIRAIVDAAVPRKRTLRGEIRRLMATVGLRRAFCGVGDAAAASLIVSAAAMLLACLLQVNTKGDGSANEPAVSLILFLTPLLYFSLLAFTAWKERITKTWEVLTACRYNLRHLTAIRLIIVSAAGLLFIPLVTLPLIEYGKYARVIAAAFCALFLYSVLTLTLLLISERAASRLAAPVLWVCSWGLLFVNYSVPEIEGFIAAVPAAVTVILAASLVALYLLELRLFILRATRFAVPV